jgi:hypothetical protein
LISGRWKASFRVKLDADVTFLMQRPGMARSPCRVLRRRTIRCPFIPSVAAETHGSMRIVPQELCHSSSRRASVGTLGWGIVNSAG